MQNSFPKKLTSTLLNGQIIPSSNLPKPTSFQQNSFQKQQPSFNLQQQQQQLQLQKNVKSIPAASSETFSKSNTKVPRNTTNALNNQSNVMTPQQCPPSARSMKSPSSQSTISFDFLQGPSSSRTDLTSDVAGEGNLNRKFTVHLNSQTATADENLFEFIKRCDLESVRDLLQQGEVTPSATDSEGNTSLHICMQSFTTNPSTFGQIATLLLSPIYNANPNARNSENWCPLHLAAKKGALSAMRFALSHNILILQTHHEFKQQQRHNQQQQQQQLNNKNITTTTTIAAPTTIISPPSSIFDMSLAGGPESQTILHIAASIGHISMLEFLYKLNYDMNCLNGLGQSARQVAIHSQILHKVLLKYEHISLQDDMFHDAEHPENNRVLHYHPNLLIEINDDLDDNKTGDPTTSNPSKNLLNRPRILIGSESRNVSELKKLITQRQHHNSFHQQGSSSTSKSPTTSPSPSSARNSITSNNNNNAYDYFHNRNNNNNTGQPQNQLSNRSASFLFSQSSARHNGASGSANATPDVMQQLLTPLQIPQNMLGLNKNNSNTNSTASLISALPAGATSFQKLLQANNQLESNKHRELLLLYKDDDDDCGDNNNNEEAKENSNDKMDISNMSAATSPNMNSKTRIDFFDASNLKRETELSDLDCEEVCNYQSEIYQQQQQQFNRHSQSTQSYLQPQQQSNQNQSVQAPSTTSSEMMLQHGRSKADWNVSHSKQQIQFQRIAKQQRVPLSTFLKELPHIFELITSLSSFSNTNNNTIPVSNRFSSSFVTSIDITSNNSIFSQAQSQQQQLLLNKPRQLSSHRHRSPSPNWMPPVIIAKPSVNNNANHNTSSYNQSISQNNVSSFPFDEIDEAFQRESRSEILRLMTYLHLIHLKFVRMDSIRFTCDPMPPNLQVVSDNLDFAAEQTASSSLEELQRKQSRIIPSLMLDVYKHLIQLLQHPDCFQVSQNHNSIPDRETTTQFAQVSLDKPLLINNFSQQQSSLIPRYAQHAQLQHQINQQNEQNHLQTANFTRKPINTQQKSNNIHRINISDTLSQREQENINRQTIFSGAMGQQQSQVPRIPSDDIFTCMLRLLRFFEVSAQKSAKSHLKETLSISGKSPIQRYIASDAILVKKQSSFSPFSIFQQSSTDYKADQSNKRNFSSTSQPSDNKPITYVEKYVICHRESHFSEKTLLDFECFQTHAYLSTTFAFDQPTTLLPLNSQSRTSTPIRNISPAPIPQTAATPNTKTKTKEVPTVPQPPPPTSSISTNTTTTTSTRKSNATTLIQPSILDALIISPSYQTDHNRPSRSNSTFNQRQSRNKIEGQQSNPANYQMNSKSHTNSIFTTTSHTESIAFMTQFNEISQPTQPCREEYEISPRHFNSSLSSNPNHNNNNNNINYKPIFRSQDVSPRHSRQSSIVPSPMKAVSSLIQPNSGDMITEKAPKINDIRSTQDTRLRNISALNSQRSSHNSNHMRTQNSNLSHTSSFSQLLRESEASFSNTNNNNQLRANGGGGQVSAATGALTTFYTSPNFQPASINSATAIIESIKQSGGVATSQSAQNGNTNPSSRNSYINSRPQAQFTTGPTLQSSITNRPQNTDTLSILDVNKLASGWLDSHTQRAGPLKQQQQQQQQQQQLNSKQIAAAIANNPQNFQPTNTKISNNIIAPIQSDFNKVNFLRGRHYQNQPSSTIQQQYQQNKTGNQMTPTGDQLQHPKQTQSLVNDVITNQPLITFDRKQHSVNVPTHRIGLNTNTFRYGEENVDDESDDENENERSSRKSHVSSMQYKPDHASYMVSNQTIFKR